MIHSFSTIAREFQPIATDIIAVVAVSNFFNARSLWKQSNRPIVSALVETNSSGNIATFFDITVINSGNRPAINIELEIDDYTEFKNCIKTENNESIEDIIRCFDKNSVIPLLINGKTTTNSFGLTSVKKEQNFWNYGSNFSITIKYRDLEGNRYKSKLTLYIKDSSAFAGGSWID